MRAVQMRVTVLALTDHDTIAGIDAAQRAIAQHKLALKLIPGVEISTLWNHHEIHILGLGINVDSSVLSTLLSSQVCHRMRRAEAISMRLEKAHIPGALKRATELAGGGSITRGHFARFLVEQGEALNQAQVFKKYLVKGKPGYVPPQWCTIEEAIDTIHHSGGQAVLAHPGSYQLSAKWLKRLINHFAQEGGDAIEVAQCQQSLQERRQLAVYADENGLAVSQGSDFHRPCAWIELGRNLWLPGGADAVWMRYPQLQPSKDVEYQEKQ